MSPLERWSDAAGWLEGELAGVDLVGVLVLALALASLALSVWVYLRGRRLERWLDDHERR